MNRRFICKRAFSLVEVTLALGLAAFCLVAIFGLLPIGMKTSEAAVEQTDASRIAAAVAADLRSTPPGQTVTRQYAISIPAAGAQATSVPLYFDADAASSSTVRANSLYLLTLTFPKTAGGRLATLADLKVTWPAQATVANASGSIETLVALDRN